MLAAYAARVDADDPLSALEVGERPEPAAPDGWATVSVRAASLNHHDVWALRGVALSADQTPMILGGDAAGVDEDGNEVVVHSVIGDPDAGGGDETYDPVPYFWSEQFGRMVQYAGHHGGSDRVIWRGDLANREWTACWLAGPPPADPGAASGTGERLVALLAVGRPRDLLQGRRLIAAGAAVDPRRLADPSIPVRDAVLGGG